VWHGPAGGGGKLVSTGSSDGYACRRSSLLPMGGFGSASVDRRKKGDVAEVPDLSASRDNSDLAEDDPCDPTTTSKPRRQCNR
jgi:hypothetical protein